MVGERMELKDLVQSTLKELDIKQERKEDIIQAVPITKKSSNERAFLLNSKEKIEVLFEGLNSKENQKVESKLNLVINFLQFYLSQIDSHLDKCPK